jgi:hypothetical protein
VKERPNDKCDMRAATIAKTGKQLILEDSKIDMLNVEELNRQLDWHRNNEKMFTSLMEHVLLKSHMSKKADRVRELKKAVERYRILHLEPPLVAVDIEMMDSNQDDSKLFYASDYEDNMV